LSAASRLSGGHRVRPRARWPGEMVAQFELPSFVVTIVELGEWFRLVLCRIVADEVMNIH
jgi:hypothetical protein